MSSLFSNYICARILWVFGLVFLIVCCAFGGVSKVIYPTAVDLNISENVQRFIGVIQLVNTLMLLWKPSRRKGIGLAGLNFAGWMLWFGATDFSTVLFCLFGVVISGVLFFGTFNFYPTLPEQESPLEERVTGSVELKSDAEVEIIEQPPEPALWMDRIDQEDLMAWVFGDE